MRSSLLVAVLIAALFTSACSPPASSGMQYQTVHMTSGDGQAELLLRPQGSVRGLVLFMHGFASDEKQLIVDSSFFPVRDALLSNGFAIVSSNAHGNNVGNAVSVRDQQAAVKDAEGILGTVQVVYILAFSMGGLDALLTAATHAIAGLRAVALLAPVTNTTAFLDSGYRQAISAAFGDPPPPDLAQVVASHDPMLLPTQEFVGYTYRFWYSTADTVVPATQSEQMVSRLVRAGATATVAALSGNHGDFSNLRPAQVIDLFTGEGSP